MKVTKQQLDAQPKYEVDSDVDFCHCCNKVLKSNKTVWLEQSIETTKFYITNVVPQEKSQGYKPFGLTCAKKIALSVY
jgi:hypothetical protein